MHRGLPPPRFLPWGFVCGVPFPPIYIIDPMILGKIFLAGFPTNVPRGTSGPVVLAQFLILAAFHFLVWHKLSTFKKKICLYRTSLLTFGGDLGGALSKKKQFK